MNEAKKAYEARQEKAKRLINQLTLRLEIHNNTQKKHPHNWGYVGDVGAVVKNLEDLLDTFTV